jgi:hypothetical protein
MNLDSIPDRAWTAVIEGTVPIQFEFLGIQIFLSTLRQRLRLKEITLPNAIREFKNVFVKYSALRAAQNDLLKITKI